MRGARVIGDCADMKGRHALAGLLQQAFFRNRSEIANRLGFEQTARLLGARRRRAARPKGEGARLLDQQNPLTPRVHRQFEAQSQQRNRRHLDDRRRWPRPDAAQLVLSYGIERSFNQSLSKDRGEGVTARDERGADRSGLGKGDPDRVLPRPRAAIRSRKTAGR